MRVQRVRLAGAGNPTLLPGVELAWQLSGGDVQLVKQAIQPQARKPIKLWQRISEARQGRGYHRDVWRGRRRLSIGQRAVPERTHFSEAVQSLRFMVPGTLCEFQ
jgi:hypothetical protein